MPACFAGVDPRVPGGFLLPADRAALLELLQALPPGTLICTASTAGPAAELRRCLRAGARPDVRLIELALPPTVIPVIASVLAVGGFPAGALATLAAEVVDACSTVAVVDGVGLLEEPAPSVLQHALGWLPGVRFGIDARAGIVRRNWMPTALSGRTAVVTVSAAADDPASLRWRDQLEKANASQQTFQMDAAGTGRWGARRWAEVTAVPISIDALASWLRPRVRIVGCPWCGSGVSAGGCPFCGIVPAGVQPTTGQLPGAPGPTGQVPVASRVAGPSSSGPPGAAASSDVHVHPTGSVAW